MDIERLAQGETPSVQKRILEVLAKDLPINNRQVILRDFLLSSCFNNNAKSHSKFRTMNGSLRYCDKCLIIKPDRAHHCSVCGTCVLKMDHHCPWVNNCVNFTNYKYFVLFLGYGLLYCIYIALTALKYFILFWEVQETGKIHKSLRRHILIHIPCILQGQLERGVGRFHILFLFFVSAMFAISLVSLFGYHIYLVALNRTTLGIFYLLLSFMENLSI